MQRLTFIRNHLSIESFPEVTIPNFVLLTGMNGAGKSHFLQAIQRGDIRTDCAPNQTIWDQSGIRMFDWNSMVPADTGYFSGATLAEERVRYYQEFKNANIQTQNSEEVKAVARHYGIPLDIANNLEKLSALKEEDLQDLGIENYEEIFMSLRDSFTSSEMAILNYVGDDNAKDYLRAAAEYNKKPLVSLEERDIVSKAIPVWGRNEIFQQSFARLFVSYRDAFLSNTIRNYRKSEGHEVDGALSDAEFINIHGPAPWDFVNDILRASNLGFRINIPDLYSDDQYKPILTKEKSSKQIEFSALSSGEKILMSFAFCVYYASDKRQTSVFPKLLLLDEIDAPLHPSMSKNMVNTIISTLVGQHNIKVIATTHSPSTIALTPEDAIYVIKAGEPGIHKISKSKALNIITHGVPTLAISYDGRRQVFVESPGDAKIYDGVYKLIKQKINSERSLDFIATGVRNATGEERNTGCDVVRRLLSSLTEAGNISTMGLIDWDGSNDPSGRLYVLAHGKKNGLENVVLDPLAIALLAAREKMVNERIPSLLGKTFFHLMSASNDVLQGIVDEVCFSVLGDGPLDKVENKYLGGLSLSIDQRWYATDDHTLESMILRTFPSLKSVTKGRAGILMQNIVDYIYSENIEIIPLDFLDTFEAILKADT